MSARNRKNKEVVFDKDGLLNVFKPPGMTSHDVVYALRRRLKPRKLGHGGTLDPVACGVLVCLVNRGTRLSQTVSKTPKVYRALALLGIKTDTGDVEGKIEEKSPVRLEGKVIESVLADFTGDIEQVPPMTSAIKVDGKRLYKLAHKGIEVERPARTVHIERLELVSFMPDPEYPRALLEIECSGGTYIRTLVEDIGNALGVPATTAFLVRTAVGQFDVRDAVNIEDITLETAGGLLAQMQ